MIKTRILKIVFTIFWISICGATLMSFLQHPKAWIDQEITILYLLMMLTISFPSGTIYWAILSAIAIFIPELNWGRNIEFILVWMGFVVVGYLQWMYLLPSIFNIIKHRYRSQSGRDIKNSEEFRSLKKRTEKKIWTLLIIFS